MLQKYPSTTDNKLFRHTSLLLNIIIFYADLMSQAFDALIKEQSLSFDIFKVIFEVISPDPRDTIKITLYLPYKQKHNYDKNHLYNLISHMPK